MGEPKLVGLVLGLAIGIVFVWIGLWQALVVGVVGMAGFLVGKYIERELAFVDRFLARFVESRKPDEEEDN